MTKSEPMKGRVRILANSGLRKLRRAFRRGMIPDERQVIIDNAFANAAKRKSVYRNANARG